MRLHSGQQRCCVQSGTKAAICIQRSSTKRMVSNVESSAAARSAHRLRALSGCGDGVAQLNLQHLATEDDQLPGPSSSTQSNPTTHLTTRHDNNNSTSHPASPASHSSSRGQVRRSAHQQLLARRSLLAAAVASYVLPALAPNGAPAPSAAVMGPAGQGGLLSRWSWSIPAALAGETPAPPATIRPEVAPDQMSYDASDLNLREASRLLQEGLAATNVEQEERAWTAVIEKYKDVDAPWAADVVGRAWGNRGNARSRQGKLQEALADYNQAIIICPWSPDPVLNRGVVLEALGRWEEAVRDYRAVLEVAPEDPAAWNNLGNATAGLGRWDEAAPYYQRAVQLAPEFSFAAANFALAQYQLGRTNEAVKAFRTLLRRYPDFPDMRAALAAALWADGLEAQAESAWSRVDDPRYRDRQWLRTNRRWPPRLLSALEAFLDVRSVPSKA